MAEPLKNMYTTGFIKKLADTLKTHAPSFDKEGFQKAVLNADWKEKELKARTNHIAEQMVAFLPYSYPAQIAILKQVAPHFNGFAGTIFPTVVELFGQHDFETSLDALESFTTHSTSEFAIRPFLASDPRVIERLYAWSKSENHHVRRLASEGCRPLLPWAMKLHQYVADPSPILPILTTLRNDPEDYVYRSVANNLNDISKNHPDLVLDLCQKWVNESKTTRWVAKHALRTLLKKGNQTAMQLFGFGPIKAMKITQFELAHDTVEIGEATEFLLDTTNTGPKAKFRLEYAVSYLKQNGTYTEKVFQIRENELKKNESIVIIKKVDFKNLTTRNHYPGLHFITLKINGINLQRLEITLK